MGNVISRKKVDYFDMFSEGASVSLKAAKLLKSAFSDSSINVDELKLIKDAEHEGDRHVHHCLKVLDEAFITPIDRTDIMEIIKGIENVTDSIDAISNHIYMMNINQANEYICKFVALAVVSCERLYDLMVAIKQYKKAPKVVSDLIIEINRLEEEGDATYSASMRKLFEFETNPITIIKNKELYQLLEQTLDCCEDVADMVEKIMISSN